MAEKVDFHQIVYREAHKDYIFPFAKPYFNKTLTPFFENSVITELVLNSDADKIAVCSWALRHKMTMRIPPRRELTEEVLYDDFVVMSFTKNSPEHDMLTALEVWHNGSLELLKKIWGELGYDMPNKVKFPIYQNAFCAKTEVYLDYVTNFLVPAMYLMEFDDEIKKLCYKDSGYRVTILGQPVDMENITKNLGISYFPMHPFLLERCFSLWINNMGLKVVYL